MAGELEVTCCCTMPAPLLRCSRPAALDFTSLKPPSTRWRTIIPLSSAAGGGRQPEGQQDQFWLEVEHELTQQDPAINPDEKSATFTE
jgi:hypothetical protein